jgi:hypothetical protein
MFQRLVAAAAGKVPTLINPWPTAPLAGAGPSEARAAIGTYRGSDDTLRKMLQYATGPEGEQSLVVRQWSEAIIRKLRPKDYLSEILALRHWTIGPWLRYTNDPTHVELVKTPQQILSEIATNGVALVDCDDVTCLTTAMGLATGKAARFVVVAFSPGGQFTHVFMQLQEPRSETWIACDPVAGSRDSKMLRGAKRHRIVDVHPL